MLTVNELAIQGDAPAHVVRYYVRIGLIRPVAQQQNGYRLFASREASRLRFIRAAKQLGFTLNEIRRIVQQADGGAVVEPREDVRRIAQEKRLIRPQERTVAVAQPLGQLRRPLECLTVEKVGAENHPDVDRILFDRHVVRRRFR